MRTCHVTSIQSKYTKFLMEISLTLTILINIRGESDDKILIRLGFDYLPDSARVGERGFMGFHILKIILQFKKW